VKKDPAAWLSIFGAKNGKRKATVFLEEAI
jgi:hypothetical protein